MSGSDWDRLYENSRVTDEEWGRLLEALQSHDAVNSEISSDGIAELLDDALGEDDWRPSDTARVGWRTAAPLFVLSCLGLLGGIAALTVLTVCVRPLPAWVIGVLLAVIIAGSLGLFRFLPRSRDPFDGDDGSRV